jgi:hypothetical protein
MDSIRTFTSLTVDNLITVKVAATNSVGQGTFSEVNVGGAKIETIPSSISTLSYDSASSTNTAIVLTWSALTGTPAGGASVSIDSYTV